MVAPPLAHLKPSSSFCTTVATVGTGIRVAAATTAGMTSAPSNKPNSETCLRYIDGRVIGASVINIISIVGVGALVHLLSLYSFLDLLLHWHYKNTFTMIHYKGSTLGIGPTGIIRVGLIDG